MCLIINVCNDTNFLVTVFFLVNKLDNFPLFQNKLYMCAHVYINSSFLCFVKIINFRHIWSPILTLALVSYIILSRFPNMPKPSFLPGKSKINIIPIGQWENRGEYIHYFSHRPGSLVHGTLCINICCKLCTHLPELCKD